MAELALNYRLSRTSQGYDFNRRDIRLSNEVYKKYEEKHAIIIVFGPWKDQIVATINEIVGYDGLDCSVVLDITWFNTPSAHWVRSAIEEDLLRFFVSFEKYTGYYMFAFETDEIKYYRKLIE